MAHIHVEKKGFWPYLFHCYQVKGKLYQDMMYLQVFLCDVDKLITEIKGLIAEMKVKGPEVTSNIQSAVLLLSEGEVKANVLFRAIQYCYFISKR